MYYLGWLIGFSVKKSIPSKTINLKLVKDHH
jgi:hypothetical protein